MTALLVIEGYLNMHYRRDCLLPRSLRQRPREHARARTHALPDTTRVHIHARGCIKDDSGELLKHALKKKSAAFLSGAFLMELSPYISLWPHPPFFPSPRRFRLRRLHHPHHHAPQPPPTPFLFFSSLTLPENTNAHRKNTHTQTFGHSYCADEPLHTVLRHAVHVCEMLLQVRAREFHLAQRALDSLAVGRKEKRRKGQVSYVSMTKKATNVRFLKQSASHRPF